MQWLRDGSGAAVDDSLGRTLDREVRAFPPGRHLGVRTVYGGASYSAASPVDCVCAMMRTRLSRKPRRISIVRSREPGYLCTYDDYGEEHYATLHDSCEDDFAPARIVRTEVASHRIEPAASHPVPPHHALSAGRFDTVAHERVPASVRIAEMTHLAPKGVFEHFFARENLLARLCGVEPR